MEGQFVDSYDPTIENTFKKTVNVKNSGTYDLLLVDTAGQDEYSIFPSGLPTISILVSAGFL